MTESEPECVEELCGSNHSKAHMGSDAPNLLQELRVLLIILCGGGFHSTFFGTRASRETVKEKGKKTFIIICQNKLCLNDKRGMN